MPLYKTISVSSDTCLYLWKIEETIEELLGGIPLCENSKLRLNKMLSTVHQCGFVSIRHLLKVAGYSDFDLLYESCGRPYLTDGKNISISHSHQFTGIIISNQKVGIDIEKHRDKILRIANKFTPLKEYRTLANDEAVIQKLTIVWCIKEALYKMYEQDGVSFLNNIDVADFDFDDRFTTADISFNGKRNNYEVKFFEFEGFACAYTLADGFPKEKNNLKLLTNDHSLR